jgi:DNA-binding CsgD family transcriptional regulator/GAF domain-containing protein
MTKTTVADRQAPQEVGGGLELVHFAHAVCSASSLEELGRRFAAGFAPLFESAPMYGLYVVEPWSGRPELVNSVNVSDVFLARYEQVGREVDTLTDHLLATQRPAYNIDLMSMEEWLEHPLYRNVKRLHDIRQELEAPIVTRDGIVGTIHVGSSDEHRGFTPHELRLAEAVGRMVGATVERIHYTDGLEREVDLAQAALESTGTAIVLSDRLSPEPRPNAAARRVLAETLDGEVLLHRLTARPAAPGGFSRRVEVELVGGRTGFLVAHSTPVGADGDSLVTVLELQRAGGEIGERTLIALTPREREVALRVVDGLSDREIAERLVLSPHTVSQYVKRVYRKLDVDSRVALTRLLLGR